MHGYCLPLGVPLCFWAMCSTSLHHADGACVLASTCSAQEVLCTDTFANGVAVRHGCVDARAYQPCMYECNCWAASCYCFQVLPISQLSWQYYVGSLMSRACGL